MSKIKIIYISASANSLINFYFLFQCRIYFRLEALQQYLQFKGINTENDNREVVIYARVSTRNQKDDLQNQVSFLRQFCNARGIIVDQCIEEYGSGLNYNRKKWNK